LNEASQGAPKAEGSEDSTGNPNRKPSNQPGQHRMTITEASTAATAVALGIGGLAKQWQAFPDRYIPTLVAVVGSVIVPALAGWNANNLVAGLTAGLAATGANQWFRQARKDQ